MKYNQLRDLDEAKFRRLTGIKRTTFEKMVSILITADQNKKRSGGRKSKLCVEDRLLMCLEYIREYRTYFHISQSYGISESSAYKNILWVESTLIKHPDFALPGRKELVKGSTEYELILIDATESPVERPKKSNEDTIQVKRKDIQ